MIAQAPGTTKVVLVDADQLFWSCFAITIVLLCIAILLYLLHLLGNRILGVLEDIRVLDYDEETQLAGSRPRRSAAGSDVCGHRIWNSDKSYQYCGHTREEHAQSDTTYGYDHEFDGRDISEDFDPPKEVTPDTTT